MIKYNEIIQVIKGKCYDIKQMIKFYSTFPLILL